MTDTQPPAAAARLPGRPRQALVVLAADLLCVLVFVVIGRRSHQEGSAVAGTVATAWPFLAGAAAGNAAVAAAGWPQTSWRAGAAVLASTVGVGMLLRGLVGGRGTPPSFVAVATGVLALFILGWRLVVQSRGRSVGRPARAHP